MPLIPSETDSNHSCNHKHNSEDNTVFDSLFNPCFLTSEIDFEQRSVFLFQIEYSEYSEFFTNTSTITEKSRAPPQDTIS